MKLRKRIKPGARIEMIPLIDIIFLLLVVFIYAMLSMTVHKGIRIELPAAATAEAADREEERFCVSITASGSVYADLEAVDLPALSRLVQERVNRSGKLHVLINAHRSISHGRLVEVLDSIRAGGVTSLSIMTTDSIKPF